MEDESFISMLESKHNIKSPRHKGKKKYSNKVNFYPGVGSVVNNNYYICKGKSNYNHDEIMDSLKSSFNKKYVNAYESILKLISKTVNRRLRGIKEVDQSIDLFSTSDIFTINNDVSAITLLCGVNVIDRSYKVITGYEFPIFAYLDHNYPEISKLFNSLKFIHLPPNEKRCNSVIIIKGYPQRKYNDSSPLVEELSPKKSSIKPRRPGKNWGSTSSEEEPSSSEEDSDSEVN